MDTTEVASIDSRLARVEALYWIDKRTAFNAAQLWLGQLGPGDHEATSRRLELVQASVRVRSGEISRGALQAQQILIWAVENGDFAVQSRCHRVLGAVFDMVGDSAMALEHAVAANNLLADSEEPIMRAAVRLCLADALGCAGSHDEAEIRYGEALTLVSDDDETKIRYVILNNLAFNCFRAHKPTQALAVVQRLLTVSKLNGRPLEMHARDTVGRIYLTVGRVIEAVQVLLPAMDAVPADSNPDDVAMCLVALAEVFRAQGQPDEAQQAINRCQVVCREHELTHWAAEISREQAETFAATEDFRGAFEAYRDYHQKFELQRSKANEARGRLLETMFRTTEARRESERYRELAVRDPLTGLHNRRYVDEQLSLALMRLRDGGPQLAIAMIDLDHFKQVNDRFSHEVGDDVLRAVGKILSQAVSTAPGAVAARMGGEEFLLVLPDLTPDVAGERFEALRRSIADYDWRLIAAGLTVTASIGVVVAPADGQRSPVLLRTADARLYLAKGSGRNRVICSSAEDRTPDSPPRRTGSRLQD
jgi:two-component system cell cycle response regulator